MSKSLKTYKKKELKPCENKSLGENVKKIFHYFIF